MSTWIFGYGSLVAPASLATTIGRVVVPGHGMHVVRLDGFGRRWNYGSASLRGRWTLDDGAEIVDGLVVSLGLIEADDESTNGVIFEVDDEELADLDWRERAYDRIDVTERVSVLDGGRVDAPIAVYFPHRSSVERYERHRDAGTAAIRRSYWDLVDAAFAELGADHLEWYRRTPAPDVPIAEITLDPVRPRPSTPS